MNRMIATSAIAAMTYCTGCYKVVAPGHVGIVVKQSGSDRGVQDFPIQSGRVWYNPINEVVLTYPTYVQRAIWSASPQEGRPVNDEISFQSAEGLRFTADVNVSYELVRDQVPHFYVTFRNDDLDSFTHGFFHDAVRNAFKTSAQYRAEDINGVRQSELIDKVLDQVKQTMRPYGVEVIQLGFAAPPRPPETVKEAIEAKIAATQHAERAENEKREAVAQAAKGVEIARGQALANDLLTKSLTPELVQWKQLEILEQKWNGQFPQVVGNGAMPFLPVQTK
ncbi:MAG TPA: SPFH domain-containing protein [Bryobacteraceae bacterium]|nr:SPFH domain-containing protein [Bryobacteraceae bacterium]